MPEILTITNHGSLITSSNYWQSEAAARGQMYLSLNAGCFRLLLPDSKRRELDELRTGKLAVISRGVAREPKPGGRIAMVDAVEVMLDDDSDSPYALMLAMEQVQVVPRDDDSVKEFLFSVWVWKGKPHKAMERPARYRRVKQLPCMEPWK